MPTRRLLRWTLGCAAALALVAVPARAQTAAPPWPDVTREARPWTRWWWHGSAVNPRDLSASLRTFRAAGLGGVEITPIYGVRGAESRFIPFLSPEWVRMLRHTVVEAQRLGMGVDMATGTGWPFGGPWVGEADAARYVTHRTFALAGGERLRERVELRQEPLVRAVLGRVDIGQLRDPIATTPDLQSLGIDQVRFPRPLPLVSLMAYSDAGRALDVTSLVRPDGTLDWTAPPGRWTLYAVFQGWHGKQVERAAPGGEGNVIDHFTRGPVRRYLARFDRALGAGGARGVRSFFNDSYEVDDASGQANWTPDLLAEFERRRGYDLRAHFPALFGDADPERGARVRSDFRETISDLILDGFTLGWREWARGRGALVRNQAHGSPGNVLDLYAASDIPETEGSDVLRFKFASSAAHLAGRRLVSAEAATWLNEHFLSSLDDVRQAVDLFFLGGVNHIFYHGTAYSPAAEPWPGWLFYAAVEFQPTNPLWRDFGALNGYVARAQSFLQQGRPDNDVLLYFPIYDRFADTRGPLLEHFDHLGPQFEGTSVRAAAELLVERGFAFDFVSDRQLGGARVANGAIRTAGAAHRALLLPETRFAPLATVRAALELARSGAAVMVHRDLPRDVPGLADLDARRAELGRLLAELRFGPLQGGVREARVGAGRVLVGDELEALLAAAGVRREPMVEHGLRFARRRVDGGHVYFVANRGTAPVDGWVALAVEARSAALYDPMRGVSGYAAHRAAGDGGSEVYLQLSPGESRVVRTYGAARSGRGFPYLAAVGEPVTLDGAWSLRFGAGGPELPPPTQIDRLGSWTELDGETARSFAGEGSYALSFAAPPGDAEVWVLDLGRVCESARVRLNGEELATLIGPRFRVPVPAGRLRARNTLEVSVVNLMANRIADMDRRGVPWKKFYNVNVAARLRENRNDQGIFDASRWEPRCSGLLGPVTLTPARSLRP